MDVLCVSLILDTDAKEPHLNAPRIQPLKDCNMLNLFYIIWSIYSWLWKQTGHSTSQIKAKWEVSLNTDSQMYQLYPDKFTVCKNLPPQQISDVCSII